MIYTTKIQKAIRFSTKTHEVYQKQKRKGKDIPYITHPLSVGLILALSRASEDVVIAGILHDTIEDSISEKKVTREMIAERFGENVATLVASVTEFEKDLPWEVRKQEALEHIKTFSHESVLVKSADILANGSELLADHGCEGETVFSRFNVPKEKKLRQELAAIRALVECWPESPLASDLIYLADEFKTMEESKIDIKGLVKFEDKMYWFERGDDGGFPKNVEVLDNGKWRNALTNEVDLFDLLERGEITEGAKEDYGQNFEVSNSDKFLTVGEWYETMKHRGFSV